MEQDKLDKAIHTLMRIAHSGDLSKDRLQQYALDTLKEIAPRRRRRDKETPIKDLIDTETDITHAF